MFRRILACAAALAALALGAVTSPKQHLGWTPGDEKKLANYREIVSYFEELQRESDRIRLREFGKTSMGRPMYAAFISSPENLRALDRYIGISARLAHGDADEPEAKRLAAEGKAIVWIDSGLHATEVAPAQQAPELAYKLVTAEDDETRAIRDNVILVQIPCINPDGLDMVVDWYRSNLGTPYELAPLTTLYQKYSGHDNNRDWFMLNLRETRAVTKLLFGELFPQIVYNQHQAPPFPARIFVPPYAEPLNPNIQPAVMDGINLIGSAMRERFNRNDQAGVLSYWGFDAWWNGGLRSVPAFHNSHGILTETAGFLYGNSRDYNPSALPERFGNGLPTKQPTVFYDRPWMGGRWGVRDAIDYMLTADWAILELAARRREQFLYKSWEMARANIAQKGQAYAIADSPVARELLWRLQAAGIVVERSKSSGKFVIRTDQPFRGYLVDLMEPQRYPQLTRRPYDISGWTLPMQMGVTVDRIDRPADLEPAGEIRETEQRFKTAARIAIYESWLPNADAGWTEWVLDRFQVPYSAIHNEDFHKGGLRARFDTIVLPSQSAQSILHGIREGERSAGAREEPTVQRPQYTGGIGLNGLAELDRFVREGGTLVALDAASSVPVENFPLPIRLLVRSAALPEGAAPPEGGYYCPGSILRMTADTAHPIAKDTPADFYAFSNGGQAYDIWLLPDFNKGDREVKVVARYAAKNVLASGWLSGENAIAGKPALVEARHGQGRVVLFGFRPQHRGQTWGTFKLLLNAIALPNEPRP